MKTMDPIELSIQVSLPTDQLEPILESTNDLIAQLREVGVSSVRPLKEEDSEPGTKAIDLVVLGTILVGISPILLEKLLSFIHAWALRREGRAVKVKYQRASGESIELDVPTIMSKSDAQDWMRLVMTALDETSTEAGINNE